MGFEDVECWKTPNLKGSVPDFRASYRKGLVSSIRGDQARDQLLRCFTGIKFHFQSSLSEDQLPPLVN